MPFSVDDKHLIKVLAAAAAVRPATRPTYVWAVTLRRKSISAWLRASGRWCVTSLWP